MTNIPCSLLDRPSIWTSSSLITLLLDSSLAAEPTNLINEGGGWIALPGHGEEEPDQLLAHLPVLAAAHIETCPTLCTVVRIGFPVPGGPSMSSVNSAMSSQ